MDIGTKIREMRKENNLTQIELARKVGMSVNSIRLYEAGKRLPSIEVRINIAEAMGFDSYELMTEQEAAALVASSGIGYWARDDELRNIGYTFSEEETKLIESFSALNVRGQKEAVRNVGIIAGNPLYKRSGAAEDGTSTTASPPDDKKPPEGAETPTGGNK